MAECRLDGVQHLIYTFLIKIKLHFFDFHLFICEFCHVLVEVYVQVMRISLNLSMSVSSCDLMDVLF